MLINQDYIVKSWIVEKLAFGSKQVMFFEWFCPLCGKKFTYHQRVESVVRSTKTHLNKFHNMTIDTRRKEKIDFASIKKAEPKAGGLTP